ncbi:MAG: DUF1080 domain-containing protein [Candidatus Brocadiia bacterium]
MRGKLLVALIACGTLAGPLLGAESTPPEGFAALFNGEDFTGWEGKGNPKGKPTKDWRDHWKTEDGVIHFDGKGPHLWTTESFKDFVLLVDWRFPKPGDSGIYLRGRGKSQVNIWCNKMGSGEVWGYRTDKNMPEEVRQACTPKKRADKPVGEWNTFKIQMKGEVLNVWLNGQHVIVDATLPGVPAEGPIALQRHGNPIDFRNIFIKELGDEEGEEAATLELGPAAPGCATGT